MCTSHGSDCRPAANACGDGGGRAPAVADIPLRSLAALLRSEKSMPSSRSACSAVPHSADAGGARNSRSGPGPARADQTQPGALCLRAGGGLPATNRVHPRGEVPQLAGHGEYGGAGTGPRPRRAAARESLSPPRPRPPPGQQTVAARALGRPPEGLFDFRPRTGGCN